MQGFTGRCLMPCPDCERYMRERDTHWENEQAFQRDLYTAEQRADAAEARLASVPALVEAGQAFLKAWIDASVSDEEGIMMAVNPDEMRAMWQAVDDAAQEFGSLLPVYEQSQGKP